MEPNGNSVIQQETAVNNCDEPGGMVHLADLPSDESVSY